MCLSHRYNFYWSTDVKRLDESGIEPASKADMNKKLVPIRKYSFITPYVFNIKNKQRNKLLAKNLLNIRCRAPRRFLDVAAMASAIGIHPPDPDQDSGPYIIYLSLHKDKCLLLSTSNDHSFILTISINYKRPKPLSTR